VNDTTFADATENISLLSPATPTDLASAVYSAGFALACHGKNGYGAYVNGTQFSPTAGSDIEDQNASLSLNFVQVFPHLASDDIVRSRAIWQLKDSDCHWCGHPRWRDCTHQTINGKSTERRHHQATIRCDASH
jgi:hypothetical protein